MPRPTILAAAALALSLAGSLVAAVPKDDFQFEHATPAVLQSYYAISKDVCDMRAGFASGGYAEVLDVYNNGRHATRASGTKRIPKVVMDRIYTDEQFYEDQVSFYGARTAYFGEWMGAAVTGTPPYTANNIRNAAGQSWARVYHIVYVLHEMDAGVMISKTASTDDEWTDALAEVEDAWGVVRGTGPCALRAVLANVSTAQVAKLDKYYKILQAAVIAKKPADVQAARDDVADTLTALLLLLTRDAAGNKPTAESKAAAYPYFKTAEAYVATAASADTARVFQLLAGSNTPADFKGKLAKSLNAIASKNGLRLD